MKLKIVTIALTLSIIISCSNDSDENEIIQSNTVKRITEKVYYNDEILTDSDATFHYSNNQLSYVLDDNRKGEFIYDGNKIAQYKFYNNNQLEETYSFTYDSNNNIISIINSDGDEREIYQYQNNFLVNSKSQELINGTWEDFSSNNYTFNTDYNLIQEVINWYSWGGYVSKFAYEYDTKNHPFKNMNKYLGYIITFESLNSLSKNNSIKRYNYQPITSTTPTLDITSVIVYNSNDYPTSIKKYWVNNGQVGSLISEMTIEYN